MSGYISKGLKVFKPRIMDTCTYCPTGIACKCGYNCANCLKAKKLYLKIIKDTHKKYDPRLQTSTSPLLSSELKSNATVSTILPNNAPFEGDKTQKKEKRKTMFQEREKQPKTTSYYCFKNMRYNDLPCCNQCFQITETTANNPMVTK